MEIVVTKFSGFLVVFTKHQDGFGVVGVEFVLYAVFFQQVASPPGGSQHTHGDFWLWICFFELALWGFDERFLASACSLAVRPW